MIASRVPVSWLRIGGIALFLLFTYSLVPGYQRPVKPLRDLSGCHVFNQTQKIVVSVKTGATEASRKIPTQMRTTLRCIKNVIIFSDLEQEIEGYHLHNALDTVVDYAVNDNPDFQLYNQQQELWKSEKNITSLIGMKSPVDKDIPAAWRLDKYKFIHVVEKAWAMKPDMDWYFIIDADTYVLWPNMLMWLSKLDPEKKAYFGSQVELGGTRFAHGGTGIILSKAAVKEIVIEHPGTATRWDDHTFETCCGDLILAKALQEYGVELQDVWPLMSGESIYSMPFGPVTLEYWCRPALTLHHVLPEDMRDISAFERRRGATKEILTHAELFKTMLLDYFPAERVNWDNLASDKGEFGKTGGVASKTPFFEDCKASCQKNATCFQFTHHNEDCYLGMSVRRGYPKASDIHGPFTSGWNRTRLEEWYSKQPACDEVSFPEQYTY